MSINSLTLRSAANPPMGSRSSSETGGFPSYVPYSSVRFSGSACCQSHQSRSTWVWWRKKMGSVGW